MLNTSLDELRMLHPCGEGIDIADRALPEQPFTAAEARDYGISFDDILWGIAALARHKTEINQRLHAWLDDCAIHSRSLAGEEYPLQQRQSDEIHRRRDFEQQRLDAAVRAVTRYAGRVGWAAAQRAVALAARSALMTAAATGANGRVSATASATSAWKRAKDAGVAREEAWQFDRMVLWFSDPEPAALGRL
jgi:hypothetical protein